MPATATERPRPKPAHPAGAKRPEGSRLIQRLVRRSCELVDTLPDNPSHSNVMAILSLLGRVVRLSAKEEQESRGPIGRPVDMDYLNYVRIRNEIHSKTPDDIVQLLEHAAFTLEVEPAMTLALALMTQRAVLDTEL